MSLFLRKNDLLKILVCLSLLNWIRALTLCLLLKLHPRKLKNSMKILSPEVALYLYKSTIHPCMQYCCHAWAGVLSCYLEFLSYKNGYAGLPLLLLLPLLNPWLIVKLYASSLSFFHKYFFGRYSSELAQLVLHPYSLGRSTHSLF